MYSYNVKLNSSIANFSYQIYKVCVMIDISCSQCGHHITIVFEPSQKARYPVVIKIKVFVCVYVTIH